MHRLGTHREELVHECPLERNAWIGIDGEDTGRSSRGEYGSLFTIADQKLFELLEKGSKE